MNERKTHRILAAALACALLLTPLIASAEYATVKGGGLNLRQKASLKAKFFQKKQGMKLSLKK